MDQPQALLACFHVTGNLVKLLGYTVWTPQSCWAHALCWLQCLARFLGRTIIYSIVWSPGWPGFLAVVLSDSLQQYIKYRNILCAAVVAGDWQSKAKSNRICGFVLTQSGWSVVCATIAFSSSEHTGVLSGFAGAREQVTQGATSREAAAPDLFCCTAWEISLLDGKSFHFPFHTGLAMFLMRGRGLVCHLITQLF